MKRADRSAWDTTDIETRPRPVTPQERDELLALLEAMRMPTDPIAELNVQG